MEVCWAHNPEVRGSKPRSAKYSNNFADFSFVFCLFVLETVQMLWMKSLSVAIQLKAIEQYFLMVLS